MCWERWTRHWLKLGSALTLAESEGYIRLFLDEGHPIQLLLQKIKAEDLKLKAYVQKLITAFAAESKFSPEQLSAVPGERSHAACFG